VILLRRGTLQAKGEDMNFLAQYTDSITSGATNTNTAITTIDLSKSALMLLGVKNTGTANTGLPFNLIRGQFGSDSSVNFARGATGLGCSYDFAVVEFPSAISLQFFSLTLSTSGSETQTISAVNSGVNRIVILSTESGSTSFQSSFECRVALTNDTTVTVSKGEALGTGVCNFFVIELPPL